MKQDNSELDVEEKEGYAKVYIFKFDHFRTGFSGTVSFPNRIEAGGGVVVA